MNYERPKQTTLAITRSINAPPEAVYDVWLDSTSPGGPWHGCEKLLLDVKVDGLFYNCVTHLGKNWAHYGRFITLDRPRTIAHTWVSEGTRGLESVVTITFTPDGGRTTMTLEHAGVPDDAFGHQHRDGWGWVLGCIEERFAKASG